MKGKVIFFKNTEDNENRFVFGFFNMKDSNKNYMKNINSICNEINKKFAIKNLSFEEKDVFNDMSFNIFFEYSMFDIDVKDLYSIVTYKEKKDNEISNIELVPYLFSHHIDACKYANNIKLENGFIKRIEKLKYSLPTKTYAVLIKTKNQILIDKIYHSEVSSSNRVKFLSSANTESNTK